MILVSWTLGRAPERITLGWRKKKHLKPKSFSSEGLEMSQGRRFVSVGALHARMLVRRARDSNRESPSVAPGMSETTLSQLHDA